MKRHFARPSVLLLFACAIHELKGLSAIGHGGGLNGWSSNFLRLPDQRCTFVVLANSLPSPPSHAPGAISNSLAQNLLADEIAKLPPLVEDPSIDPKTFAAYVGRYDYQGAIMTVTVEDDALFSQITGQGKIRIFPKGETEFEWRAVAARVEFVKDDDGKVMKAVHHQNGVRSTRPRSNSGGWCRLNF